MKETYAVFIDLDKTLLSVNSGKALAKAAYKSKIMSGKNLLLAMGLSIIYKIRPKNAEEITKYMVRWLKGVSVSDLNNVSKHVAEDILIHYIRPEIIREINYHKKEGATIIILSASLLYICAPIANYLSIDAIICSSMETKNGLFTGRVEGNICIGKEKEIRLLDYCRQEKLNPKEAYYYGDSFSDHYALEAVGNAICVAPETKLKKRAQEKKWRVIG